MQLFEFLYYLGLSAKKKLSLKNQRRLPGKVISIGNLTVGGTGKTPATIALAEEAQKRGFYPVVLTRGYKGRARGPCFVSRGEKPLLSADAAGDEPVLMAERLPGIPIVKGRNRYEAGLFAIEELGDKLSSPVLFILDDGFQHWGLYRDKDIVLVDSTDSSGNRRLLPFGSLREPLSAISRADLIVLTKTGKDSTDHNILMQRMIEEIRESNHSSPLFFADHVPLSCWNQAGLKNSIGWISGKKVFGFCGLGRPQSFRKTLVSAGAELVGFRSFMDHYRYHDSDIRKLSTEAAKAGAEWIVTTEKDIIKLKHIDLPGNILIIEIGFSIPDAFYEEAFRL
ncbi:MAG: tetraacyldisaccharide 4'-kinase [Nitrospirae bacterium]|nr:tetraacyldisaccharide 4'-kinase [Nitrospirota bacterium]